MMALYGLSITLGAVALHGTFREPDDLFLDDGGGNGNIFSNNMFQQIPQLNQAPAGTNMV